MKSLLICLLIFAQSPAFAAPKCASIFEGLKDANSKVVHLFSAGKPVQDYTQQVEDLKPHDQFDFGTEAQFTVYKKLSHPDRGDLTSIIDIGDGKALRMSKHYSYTAYRTPEMMAQEMTDWFRLMNELEKNGVPVVKVYRQESHPPAFIVVAKETFLFRLSDLFVKGKLNFKNPSLQNIDPKIIDEALERLILFAKKTWMYQNIGDFRYEQLGYNGKEWLLFDVGGHGHLFLPHFDEKFHIFSSQSEDPMSGSPDGLGNYLTKKIRLKIDTAIQEERNNASQRGPWITRKTYTGQFGYDNYLFKGITHEPIENGRSFKILSGNPKINRTAHNDFNRDWWIERKLSLKVVSFIKSKDLFSFYNVQLKDGSTATLKILRWNSDKALGKILKQVEALKQSDELIAYGTDFILKTSNTKVSVE